MGFFKKTGAVAGLTLALAGADYAWGNQSLVEMYNLNANASPNGSPVTAFVSRNNDNADRLSMFGWGALLLPPCAAAAGGIVYIGRKLDEKEK